MNNKFFSILNTLSLHSKQLPEALRLSEDGVYKIITRPSSTLTAVPRSLFVGLPQVYNKPILHWQPLKRSSRKAEQQTRFLK